MKRPSANKSVDQPVQPGPRYFRLTYSNSLPDDQPKLFQDRDAIAFCEMAANLNRLGYEFGTTIHLYPDDRRTLKEFPQIQPSDLLVMTTRPPLQDGMGKPRRKRIHANGSELEAVIFDVLYPYFEICTRKEIQLTDEAAKQLGHAKEQWQHLVFRAYFGAGIHSHFEGKHEIEHKNPYGSSVAYYARVNGLPKIGCDLIVSFGIDGYGTLIWNRIIRQNYAAWLAAPRFVMAELIYANSNMPVPERPLTPEFADNAEIVRHRLLTE